MKADPDAQPSTDTARAADKAPVAPPHPSGTDGVTFEIALKEDRAYQIGERIPVELRFSSSIPDTHKLDAAEYDRGGRLHSDTYHLQPETGHCDPLADTFDNGFGEMGGLRATPVLTAEPHVIVRDLNEYVRFDVPGEYTLQVDSARIEMEGPDGNPLWNGVVSSNPITITVTATDPAWAQQTLEQALQTYDDSAASEEDRAKAARTLRFLCTKEAALAMVARLDDGWPGGELRFGLYGSPHREATVEALTERITAPDAAIGSALLDTLARFEAYQARGERLGPYPTDKDAQAQWQARQQQFLDLFRSRQMGHARELLDALPNKTPRARAVSLAYLFELTWSTSTVQNPPDLSAFEGLGALLVKDFEHLPVDLQDRLLRYFWAKLADLALAPALLALYQNPPADRPDFAQLALQRYTDLLPEQGRALLVEEIRKPNKVNGILAMEVLGLLGEEPLPELDAALAKRLETTDYYEMRLAAQLVERYATDAIAADVKTFYETLKDPALDTEAALLAYLLRVDAPYAEGQLRRLIAPNVDSNLGHNTLLNDVAALQMSPMLETLFIETVESHPNANFVLGAAEGLSRYGSEAARSALFARLEAFHEGWKGRAAELRYQVIGENPNEAEMRLETALWQALVRGNGWVLDAKERERLLSLIVTEREREQAVSSLKSYDEPISVDLRFDDSGDLRASVAYGNDLDSVEQVEAKIALFPAGTSFWLQVNAVSRTDEAAAAESRLEKALEAHGMKRYVMP